MRIFKRLLGRSEPDFDRQAARGPQDEPLLINAYATLREVPSPDFPHRLHGRRDLSDPELPPHLDGLIGYMMSRGDGAMTQARYHLWRHAQRVRHNLSFDAAIDDLPALQTWANATNAIFFLPDGSIRAPDFAVLLSADGQTDPAAALPYPPDAIARRARTLDYLAAIGAPAPAHIPPVLGEGEVVLRSPKEVIERALGLFYVAAQAQAHGEGRGLIRAGHPEHNALGRASLTPAEQSFVAGGPGEASMGLTWRYEAANLLLWSLGLEHADIATSDRQIDVDLLWEGVADIARNGANNRLRLRPDSEMLDALDRTWREHWVIREAERSGGPVARLNSDVISERHMALNWLTSFQNDPGAPWDVIDTPT